jgi:hypothetical protein
MNCGKQNLPCLMCDLDSRMISIGKLRTKAFIPLTHKFVKMTVGCEVNISISNIQRIHV